MEARENTFGDLVLRERKNKDWTLRDISEVTGIEASYINRLEKGSRSNPGFITVAKLVNTLELSQIEVLNSFNLDKFGEGVEVSHNKIHIEIDKFIKSKSDKSLGMLISMIEEAKKEYETN